MTGLSSGPSTEPIRTISDGDGRVIHSSSTSDLSTLSDAPPKPSKKAKSNGLKRSRESSATLGDAVHVKKAKLETEKGIYCHQ